MRLPGEGAYGWVLKSEQAFPSRPDQQEQTGGKGYSECGRCHVVQFGWTSQNSVNRCLLCAHHPHPPGQA